MTAIPELLTQSTKIYISLQCSLMDLHYTVRIESVTNLKSNDVQQMSHLAGTSLTTLPAHTWLLFL